MEYTKKIEFDAESIRFQDKFTQKDANRLLGAIGSLIICLAIIIFFLVYLVAKFTLQSNFALFVVFLILGIAVLAFTLFCIIYLIFRSKFKYNMLIDEDTIFIREGRGYVSINRFEVGSVLNNITPNSQFAIQGPGNKTFEIYAGGIIYNLGNKKIKKPIRDCVKLAYIMLNIAKNPESGINWGIAYSSAI